MSACDIPEANWHMEQPAPLWSDWSCLCHLLVLSEDFQASGKRSSMICLRMLAKALPPYLHIPVINNPIVDMHRSDFDSAKVQRTG